MREIRLEYEMTILLLTKWNPNWKIKQTNLIIRSKNLRRGSMKAIGYNLQKAADRGQLKDKNNIKSLLEDRLE